MTPESQIRASENRRGGRRGARPTPRTKRAWGAVLRGASVSHHDRRPGARASRRRDRHRVERPQRRARSRWIGSTATFITRGQARDRPHGLLLPGHRKSGDLAPRKDFADRVAPAPAPPHAAPGYDAILVGAYATRRYLDRSPRPPSRTSCATTSTICPRTSRWSTPRRATRCG